MSRSWSKGSTTAWRKTRAVVLSANQVENQGRCRLGIEGVCTGQATVVHHVKGKAYGDDIRYLMAVCAPCNGYVGDPQRVSPAPTPKSSW